jgi:hypothetical protein
MDHRGLEDTWRRHAATWTSSKQKGRTSLAGSVHAARRNQFSFLARKGLLAHSSPFSFFHWSDLVQHFSQLIHDSHVVSMTPKLNASSQRAGQRSWRQRSNQPCAPSQAGGRKVILDPITSDVSPMEAPLDSAPRADGPRVGASRYTRLRISRAS